MIFFKVGFKHESNLLFIPEINSIFLYPVSKVIYLLPFKSGYNGLSEDL